MYIEAISSKHKVHKAVEIHFDGSIDVEGKGNGNGGDEFLD